MRPLQQRLDFKRVITCAGLSYEFRGKLGAGVSGVVCLYTYNGVSVDGAAAGAGAPQDPAQSIAVKYCDSFPTRTDHFALTLPEEVGFAYEARPYEYRSEQYGTFEFCVNGRKVADAMTMPYFKGPTVSKLLRDRGKSLSQKLEYLKLHLKEMQRIHGLGIIHGDAHLNNSLIVGDRAVMIDFGYSKSLGQDYFVMPFADQLCVPETVVDESLGLNYAGEYVGPVKATATLDVYRLCYNLFSLILRKDIVGIPDGLLRMIQRGISVGVEERPSVSELLSAVKSFQKNLVAYVGEGKVKDEEVPHEIFYYLDRCIEPELQMKISESPRRAERFLDFCFDILKVQVIPRAFERINFELLFEKYNWVLDYPRDLPQKIDVHYAGEYTTFYRLLCTGRLGEGESEAERIMNKLFKKRWVCLVLKHLMDVHGDDVLNDIVDFENFVDNSSELVAEKFLEKVCLDKNIILSQLTLTKVDLSESSGVIYDSVNKQISSIHRALEGSDFSDDAKTFFLSIVRAPSTVTLDKFPGMVTSIADACADYPVLNDLLEQLIQLPQAFSSKRVYFFSLLFNLNCLQNSGMEREIKRYCDTLSYLIENFKDESELLLDLIYAFDQSLEQELCENAGRAYYHKFLISLYEQLSIVLENLSEAESQLLISIFRYVAKSHISESESMCNALVTQGVFDKALAAYRELKDSEEYSDFNFDSVLGMGAYSVVLKCANAESGESVALKVGLHHDADDLTDEAQKVAEGARDEKVKVLLPNAYVMSVVAGNIFPGSSRSQNVSVVNTLNNYLHLVDALDELHQGGLVHGDLHRGNFVLDKATSKVKLLDYGRAQYIGDELKPAIFRENGAVAGHVKHMAVELITVNSAFPQHYHVVDPSVDVFALLHLLKEESKNLQGLYCVSMLFSRGRSEDPWKRPSLKEVKRAIKADIKLNQRLDSWEALPVSGEETSDSLGSIHVLTEDAEQLAKALTILKKMNMVELYHRELKPGSKFLEKLSQFVFSEDLYNEDERECAKLRSDVHQIFLNLKLRKYYMGLQDSQVKRLQSFRCNPYLEQVYISCVLEGRQVPVLDVGAQLGRMVSILVKMGIQIDDKLWGILQGRSSARADADREDLFGFSVNISSGAIKANQAIIYLCSCHAYLSKKQFSEAVKLILEDTDFVSKLYTKRSSVVSKRKALDGDLMWTGRYKNDPSKYLLFREAKLAEQRFLLNRAPDAAQFILGLVRSKREKQSLPQNVSSNISWCENLALTRLYQSLGFSDGELDVCDSLEEKLSGVKRTVIAMAQDSVDPEEEEEAKATDDPRKDDILYFLNELADDRRKDVITVRSRFEAALDRTVSRLESDQAEELRKVMLTWCEDDLKGLLYCPDGFDEEGLFSKVHIANVLINEMLGEMYSPVDFDHVEDEEYKRENLKSFTFGDALACIKRASKDRVYYKFLSETMVATREIARKMKDREKEVEANPRNLAISKKVKQQCTDVDIKTFTKGFGLDMIMLGHLSLNKVATVSSSNEAKNVSRKFKSQLDKRERYWRKRSQLDLKDSKVGLWVGRIIKNFLALLCGLVLANLYNKFTTGCYFFGKHTKRADEARHLVHQFSGRLLRSH